MFAGVLLAVANTATVIGVGEVGVIHFLGKTNPNLLTEGLHFVPTEGGVPLMRMIGGGN